MRILALRGRREETEEEVDHRGTFCTAMRFLSGTIDQLEVLDPDTQVTYDT